MQTFIKMEDRRLAGLAEQALNELGLSFIKNQGRNVTEFEVRSPCRFLVTVENAAREQVGFMFRRKVRIESLVEVKPLIGSPEPEARLQENYRAFLGRLRGKLPNEPWEGLGVLRSQQARRAWESLG
ncbi:MAG TPA: hypothetical protein VKF15_01510 [Nitrososphaerales archaeon]|nr:hypothetical protein [Nitrososphaerales archaeon]